MAIALFAGIPSRYLQRAKTVLGDAAPHLDGWQFHYIAAPHGPELQIRDRKRIAAEALKLGSLHVLGMSAERNRDGVAAQIRTYFRFRWFDHNFLSHLNNPDPAPFVDHLIADLEEEVQWSARVQPDSLSSALLLPESSFSCDARHAGLWSKATRYGSNDSVTAAEKAIESFKKYHYRRVLVSGKGSSPHPQHKWADERRLVFDDKGERHGIAPSPRNWKYSYPIEDGFHYDVTHVDKKSFSLVDALGDRHSAITGSHLNLDPHGYVRS